MKNIEKCVSAIRKNLLFSSLSEQTVQKICKDDGCYINSYLKDDTIYYTSDFKSAAGIILSGKVSVYKTIGKRRTLLNILKEGEIFGVASMFGKVESYVTTIVAAETTEVVFLTHDVCKRLVRSEPDFAVAYISFLSDKIRYLNDKISSYTAPSAAAKLAGYLLRENRPKLSMTQLASALNIGRASLYRELDELENAGIIKKDGQTITVLDKNALGIISDGQ